ncbi:MULTISPECIES: LysR family transcriptional regulator [unclassified Rhizobium]|uniref:LysR family transcriptional regulator n=1 Tax=unclassified Rhizobium TaxID=2613769 RepID=UPI0007EA1B9E|nr:MULTISPECIES: LysR family transcriptional regulator [unclassified Rhizobium]ANM09708.1 LysR family transcriptional regulator protein [Rhizobium sp. N324]ANM16178.1 LysR family transcriptional regulator protein [Rhizobium sp. N541]ANM22563.1 LysR family transcriptional regulator protein [Rhizobium sp. N941]OWV88192.1 LysR family transcriptional regulator [Rhizobium sp. N122]OYD03277.1 LysR family transcriptional regulator protein [Rhizobium sp. N4311]
MDRLTSLAVFGRVVECGGFSAAARRLNMSVTMVGNHVQSLEDRLGVRLLNRTTRKVSLTETGKYYYERSAQILAELDEADRTASALSTTPRGTLKVYTSGSIVRFLLPVFSEYMELYPSISVDFSVGERMVDMIEDGYDLVIRTLPPDSSLIARKLTPWRHMLVCSPAYVDSHPIPLKPAEIADHNCLQYAYYPYGDEWRFEDGDGRQESVKISGNVVSNNAEMLRFLTLNGRGLFLAPSFVVFDDIAEGRLIRIMPDYKPVEFTINAVYPNRSHLPTKVRLFIDLLAERFAEHRKWMT